MLVPNLDTPRLVIRPLVMADLESIHRILQRAFHEAAPDEAHALAERRSWLEWTVLSYEWLAKLHQPPYGERGIALRSSGELIGAVGYVPCFAPFEQIPALHAVNSIPPGFTTPEFGLFWVVEPEQQGRGYASEAAQAMIAHAFEQLRVKRIVATTEYDNLASQAVMRKVGMTLTRNPLATPPWLQVVGVLDHPAI